MWHGEVRGYTKAGVMEKKQILKMFFRQLKLNQVTRIYLHTSVTKMVFI